MKKVTLLFFAIILLSFLAACGGTSTPEPLRDEDRIATSVAATLSVLPTSTSEPASVPTASQTPISNLDDFPNRVLLGENDNYAIYLINSSSGDAAEKTGEIIVYDKGKDLVYQIIGSFTFFATTIVSNDGKGEYVFLSDGSYTSRGATVISLNDKKQAVNKFCTKGQHFFWNDYLIFNNCDILQNRPWGVGEAPSVIAINLKTGTETVIAKSDLTHQYAVKQIEGDTLKYTETYVENETDWQNQDKHNTNERIYDLTLLSNN